MGRKRPIINAQRYGYYVRPDESEHTRCYSWLDCSRSRVFRRLPIAPPIGYATNDPWRFMASIADRIERARRQIELGRLAIARQREMVERHRAEGRDAKPAENLLSVLERTQKVFERDLADLEKARREGGTR